MLPIHFGRPVVSNDMLDAGLREAQHKYSEFETWIGKKQKQKTKEMISCIRKDAPTKDSNGYIYAVQIQENELVKVGRARADNTERPMDVQKCSFKAGRIFRTDNFDAVFKAEKLVHHLLSQWNSPFECTQCKGKEKPPTKHQEYFSCGLWFAISVINLVTSWFLKKPYDIEGQEGSLKKAWEEALEAFEQSQKSQHPMEWFEFFLIDVESQLSWKSHHPALGTPWHLPANPVQLVPHGTFHFASPKPKPDTPKGSPAVAQVSSLARQGHQRKRSEYTLSSRSESAPPKTMSHWDQTPSPPETPSKPPRSVPARSGKGSKTGSSSTSRIEEGQKGQGWEDVREADQEGVADEDIRRDAAATSKEDGDGEVTIAAARLTLSDGGPETGLRTTMLIERIRVFVGF
ncbi:hypothetical protein AYO21_07262 [Fonsecaea monophora]|uniref:Bacteriophage T5 Orf172 DNA-binding domain-containing protein n=1 Tax=Fonsecaea monophora TaxID=254056 RepID=A0A177F4E9_9EURO|nr:hypothetical protein AYO21_07262 [Fonsecaea monophora]KAH0828270.1 hypothetical protein FOPE_00260 [Fonsecaea pedrosoi]OAG38440.1 hypothetical protein AYO21_07262 [Fonsecaea monophora]